MSISISKRGFLGGALGGGMLSLAPAASASTGNKSETRPLIDRDRVSHVLARAGIDALILEQPENVYHATGAWPALGRMGMAGTAFAMVPRDRRAPIAHVGLQFSHYYTIADHGFLGEVEPYLVTGPGPAGAAPPMMFEIRGGEGATAREVERRKLSSNARMHASHADALRTALSAHGLSARQLGYDGLEAERLAKQASPQSALKPASDLVRHARMVKTPLELELMRAASAATVKAALATARQMRALGSLRAVMNHFNAEVSRLGNTPVFMVVDGVIAEDHDEPFVNGTTVLIDCVSHFRGYHSDFGRTVFIGEPRPEMARRVRAMGTAWNELRSQLRPGMRFSEIRRLGAQILHRIQPGMKVPFNPHCVGLAHSDQPRSALDGAALDIALEPGMVISVDCPLMEASTAGTAHIEDLTLITPGGSVPLHETGDQTIIG